jgi:hypothetical protein
MKYLKKIQVVCSISLCLFVTLIPQKIHAEGTRFLDTFDDTDFLMNEFEMSDFLDTDISSGFSLLRSNPTDILSALNAVNAIPILEQALYKRSNPLHRRDIIDYPTFESHYQFYPDDTTAGVSIFFNKTFKCKYFKNEVGISSYIAINEPDFLDALEDTVANVQLLFQDPAFNLNVTALLNLFKNAYIDERRLGGMFYLQRRWERFNLYCMIPFYYRERNFDFHPKEKAAIRKDFGDDDPKFVNQHLIADKLGLGDTRVEFGGSVYKCKTFDIELGAMATVPTAWSIKKGLRGSYFPKKHCQPTFDIKHLFDMVDNGVQPGEPAEAFGIITSFVTGALDRLSANVLDVPLGNDGHFGIGIYLRSHTKLSAFIRSKWAHGILWDWRASIEYLAGKEVKRMFIKFPDPLEFAKRNFDTTDEVLAYEYIEFLDQQLVNQFYPPFLETVVQPGIIIRSTNSFSSFRSWFGWKVGSDFWFQSKESFHINNIDASSSTLNVLRLCTAQQDYGYQWKLFGSLAARVERSNQDWVFSLDADSTLSDHGIGKDWTIAISIESHF